MKMWASDSIEAVYYTQNAIETVIPYKSRNLELNKIKAGKRDTRGVKVRA